MSTRPTGPIKWANTLLNNGPLGGPSRIDPSLDRQENGWAWADKPDFETLNGWMYNVYKLLEWAADLVEGAGGVEDIVRTIVIPNGSSYSYIQDQIDAIGGYVAYNVNIIIDFENGTYNIGSNAIKMPDYYGGGLVVFKAINPTGALVDSKNVTITGTGERMNSEDGFTEYNGSAFSQCLFINGGCPYVLIGDIEFIMTGQSPGGFSAVIRTQRGGTSVNHCTVRNEQTLANRFNGAYSGFRGNTNVRDCYMATPVAAGVESVLVDSGNNGSYSCNGLRGVGDYSYRAVLTTSYVVNDTTSPAIALTLTLAGQVILG